MNDNTKINSCSELETWVANMISNVGGNTRNVQIGGFPGFDEIAKKVKKRSKKGQKWPTNQRLNNSILVQKFYYLYGHFEHIFVTTRDQKLPIFWHFSCFFRPPFLTNCLKLVILTKITKTPIYYRVFCIFAKTTSFLQNI